MGGYFDVDPGYVAGYAQVCADTAADTRFINRYITDEVSAQYGFDGVLLEALAPVVDEYATAAAERVSARGALVADADAKLRDAAWAYSEVDRDARYTVLEDSIGRGATRVEVDLPKLVPYPSGQDVTGKLAAPELGDAGFEQLMEEHAGETLGTIDLIIKSVTALLPGVPEYSITEEITNELTGNWMALKQKADALDAVAEAAERAANNLTTSLSTLDEHWDGGAADSFSAYIQGTAAAVNYEAPLSRVVAFAYRTVADLIEKLAGVVIEMISTGVEMIRKYATGAVSRFSQAAWGWVSDGKPPWEAIEADWNKAKAFFDDAKFVVEQLHQLPEDLQTMIDACKDPQAGLNLAIKEAFGELEARGDVEEGTGEAVKLGKDIAMVSDDLGRLAGQADDAMNAPTEEFDAGRNLRRDG